MGHDGEATGNGKSGFCGFSTRTREDSDFSDRPTRAREKMKIPLFQPSLHAREEIDFANRTAEKRRAEIPPTLQMLHLKSIYNEK